jgi:site-specific recombinase XerD
MEIKILVEDVLAHVRDTRSPQTERCYATGIGRFVGYLAEQGIESSEDANRINYNHFVGFFRHLRSDGVQKSTIRTYIHSVIRLLSYGVAWNHLAMSEHDLFKIKMFLSDSMRRENNQGQSPRIEWSSVLRMMEAISATQQASPGKERDEALVRFLASTGCRVSGAANLRISDIDMGSKSAIVSEKRKSRTVYFDDETKNALLRYWLVRGNDSADSPVFSRHDKRIGTGTIRPMATTSMQNTIRQIATQAGFDSGEFTPHTFRHAFATKMLDETGNLAFVQDLLGHASPAVTRIYAKPNRAKIESAYREVFG